MIETNAVVIDMVAIKDIKFDSAYQRPLNEARASQIARFFNSGAAKAVSLSLRENGDLYCYDGQHTVQGAIKAGVSHLPAVIVNGDQAKEASWFLEIQNKTKRVFTREAQRAGVVAGDEMSIKAESILSKYGLSISTGGMHAGKTGAIGAIRRYVKQDEKSLNLAMSAIKKLWPNNDESWSSVVIRGMYEIARSDYYPNVVTLAKSKKVTPRRILDVAAAMQSATGQEKGSGSGLAKKAILSLCGLV